MSELPHLDERGQAHMIDVGQKERTPRKAVARGQIRMSSEAIDLLARGAVQKGDALAVARVAAIMAAKRTAELLPLCHPIALSGIQVDLVVQPVEQRVLIQATIEAQDRTGVEMEALTAVSVAALTLYDMLKSTDREMEIGGITLYQKEGGRTGSWQRPVKVVPKVPTPPPAPTEPPVVVPEPLPVNVTMHAGTRREPESIRPQRVASPQVRARAGEVIDLESTDPRLPAYLRQKPVERAYMLGDLDPAYAEHCAWYALPGSAKDPTTALSAVLLLYQGLRVPAVLTSGADADDVEALFHAVADRLPRTLHAQIRAHHRSAIESQFTFAEPATVMRMGLTRAEYTPSGSDAGVETIGHRDTAAIMSIYQHYPDNFFDPAQLETGLYCGIKEGGELLSLAGVHVFSKHYDVAAIGNIVTHSDHRGLGLATRCVRHLLDRLFAQVGHVGLNVAVDNTAAIACYRKFGFTERYRFLEGTATR